MYLLSNQQEFEPLPLILPGSLEYYLSSEVLGLPPGSTHYVNQCAGECAFIARPGSGGLLEAVSLQELEEYVNDGEHDLRQAELEERWALEDQIYADQCL
jgi:hypothetical protein